MTIAKESSTPHRHTIRILYADTYAAGVVYYGNYLRYLEAGRTEFLRMHGLPYHAIEERGYIMPVVECFTRYKSSAQYDDLIVVETILDQVKLHSCRFKYRIVRREDERLLTKGHTVHAIVDQQGRIVQFPEDIFQLFQKIRYNPE